MLDFIFRRRVISDKGLNFLASHSYKSGRYTFLDNWLNHHWWNVVVEWMPMWLAPNMITLIGTLAVVSTLLLAVGNMSDTRHYTEVVPAWVHWIIVAVHFFYQTLDAVDGKQARRTANASPLGQLFDHGCDALVTTVALYNIILALGLGHSWQAALLYVSALTAFYMAQWEESGTHVLRTNVGGVGVTEGQFAMMGAHLLAALVPVDAFSVEIDAAVHVGGVSWLEIHSPLNQLMANAGTAAICLVALGFLLTMIKSVGIRSLESLLPTIVCAACVLLMFSPTSMFTIGKSYPRHLFVLYALVQTNLTTIMIVYSMAHEHFSAFQLPALIVPGVFLVDLLYPKHAPTALWLGLLVAAASYVSFVFSAVHAIASRLGINALTINPPRVPAVTATATSAAVGPASRQLKPSATVKQRTVVRRRSVSRSSSKNVK